MINETDISFTVRTLGIKDVHWLFCLKINKAFLVKKNNHSIIQEEASLCIKDNSLFIKYEGSLTYEECGPISQEKFTKWLVDEAFEQEVLSEH